MKRFVFGLEKVRELRQYREQETEIELGKAVGVLTEIERKITAITAERERIEQFTPQRTEDILSFDRYILRLDKTKAAFLEEAGKAARNVEEARSVYMEASRDRKILDNMKERRYKEYRKHILTEETKTLDDLSSGVKARKLVNGQRLIQNGCLF
ncbi:MAG: flagellar export protein FliJ [Treponema sp.]|jgi:flagellar FliJ protein|nr:flagellar export protein FliJ [Treponema sp.]